jgi:hypothetical protein
MATRWNSSSSNHEPLPYEQLVLGRLGRERAFTLEELLVEVPELSWAQLFVTIDLLSRRGDIELRREGFTYTARTAKLPLTRTEGLTWSAAS